MGAFIDLTGLQFGRLTVLNRDGVSSCGGVKWRCRCSCGIEKTINGAGIKTGLVVSCGCYHRETTAQRLRIHGHLVNEKHSPEYMTWRAMLRRCKDENFTDYAIYGGRGIAVCDRWLEFTNFLADMGRRPDGSSLDRIDSDAGYSPDNCRWATAKEQARNMRSNRMMTLDGVTKCVVEWSEELGIGQNTIRGRLFAGWSDEKTLRTPVRHRTAKTN